MPDLALKVEMEFVTRRRELAAADEQYHRDLPRRLQTMTARRSAWRQSLLERAWQEQSGSSETPEAVEVWWAARAYSKVLPPSWFEQEAERLAARSYAVEIERDDEEPGQTRFLAWHPAFSIETSFGVIHPCIGGGTTPVQAERRLAEARYETILNCLEEGESVPEPEGNALLSDSWMTSPDDSISTQIISAWDADAASP